MNAHSTAAPPTFFGHPRGLATLFMTEFFERFTYYGMRALLVLFLTAAVTADNAGFGLSRETAGAIYGLYTGAVYLFSLPGGWVADRLIGQRKAVFWGGVIIMIGNFILAIPATPAVYYLGLAVIVLGVGLLKPNISAIVGELYKGQPGARRDAGFSIFYMGINLGALLAPLVAGTIGEAWNWRGGFFCAGLAMGIGLLQYKLTEHYLGEAGLHPHPTSEAERARGWKILWGTLAALAVIVVLMFTGIIAVDITVLAQIVGVAMGLLGIFYFAGVLLFAKLTTDERKRVGVIAIFFLCAAMFWAGFEQAATTFNLFAQDYTDRTLFGSWFPDGVHPASWYQSANPIFIVLLAPVFAWLWVELGKRNLDPSAPAKFGLGLVQLGLGFAVMMLAAELIVVSGDKVAPTWLLLTYLLHTTGELCLSPVGLSNVTKLSPDRFVGQMMGTWFLGAALGNLAAGLIGGHVGSAAVEEMPSQFLVMAFVGGGAGVLMLLATPAIKRMMGDVR
ncbi:MAG TPA: peptide MFS transporter [Gammaproteobacteria bacterium]|nr:peptide MFS transporter [Gammaproteobacteria bacterium]